MANEIFVASSQDIKITLNGQVIAGVQSYSTKVSSDKKEVEAFGSSEPIGYIKGRKKYSIDLNRVYLEDTAISDGIDFYSLLDASFEIVINKNGKTISYLDCTIIDISEDASLNDSVKEKVSCLARSRKVS